MPAPAPRDGWRPAAALAVAWIVVAGLLAVWGLWGSPGVPTRLPDAQGVITLPRARPPAPLLSVWLRWDAPPGRDGWVVLEPGARWPSALEPFWRRRVHPGWNLVTWSHLAWLPADEPLRLRLLEGRPAGWAVARVWGAHRYGAAHLVVFRGFLVALALALAVAALALGARLRAPARPGWWGAALGATAAVGLALRLRTLTAQSLWFDEVLTAIGSQSLDWVLYTPQIFGHPPLQYLAGWLVGPAGGDGWFRAPFVVAGTATVVALGALGRSLFGPATGLVAALVLALSPFHVELSQTARPYAPFLLLATVSFHALVRALAQGRARWWVLFSATTALALYTHYLATTLLVAEAAAALLLLGAHRWRGWLPAAVSFAAVGLLLAPWAPVLTRLAAAHIGAGELPGLAYQRLVVEVFVPQFLGPSPATAVGLALVARGLWALRARLRLAAAMAAWLLAPLVLVWTAQPAHFVAGRHLALILPPLLLLLARGVTAAGADVVAAVVSVRPWRPWLARAAGAAVALGLLAAWSLPVGAGLRHYYGSRLGYDWRTVADLLDQTVPREQRVLATVGAGYPLRHYWRVDVEVLEPDTARQQLETRRPGETVWVVTHEGWDRPAALAGWLEAHAVGVAEVPASWSLPGVRLWRVPSRR